MALKYTTDFNLKTISLITSIGVIDITQYLVELSYFEEIFSPAISGKLVLSESFGLINLSMLSGNEFIQLDFNKVSNEDDKDYENIKRIFRVFSVTNRHFDTANNYETYVLNFCSEEMYISEQYRISKSYKKKKISEIITDIMKSYLGVGNGYGKNFYYEETTGVYDFVLPNKKIFETINWLSGYAMPKNNNLGADMLFFETNMGFQFSSLQSLFSNDPVVEFTYNPKNLGTSAGDPDLGDEQYEIMKLEILDTFDTLGATTKGMFANRVITLNTLTRTTSINDFDYNKYQMDDSSVQLNEYAITNNYKNRVGGFSWDPSPKDRQTGALRLCVSNGSNQSVDYIKSKPGTVSNDFMIEKTLPYRVSQLSLTNYNRLRVTVPGYNELSVGMTINAVIFGISLSDKKEYDNYLSGRYLVSALRHIITPTSYITVLEIIKDSTISPLNGVDNSDSGYKAIVKGVQ